MSCHVARRGNIPRSRGPSPRGGLCPACLGGFGLFKLLGRLQLEEAAEARHEDDEEHQAHDLSGQQRRGRVQVGGHEHRRELAVRAARAVCAREQRRVVASSALVHGVRDAADGGIEGREAGGIIGAVLSRELDDDRVGRLVGVQRGVRAEELLRRLRATDAHARLREGALRRRQREGSRHRGRRLLHQALQRGQAAAVRAHGLGGQTVGEEDELHLWRRVQAAAEEWAAALGRRGQLRAGESANGALQVGARCLAQKLLLVHLLRQLPW